MRITRISAALLLCALPALGQEKPVAPPLDVLYVSDGTAADRAQAFESFLKKRFSSVATSDHDHVSRMDLEAADVVLLDWSMERGDMPPKSSPLGEREEWNRPTVLLGCAGLHHACAWEVAGGSG